MVNNYAERQSQTMTVHSSFPVGSYDTLVFDELNKARVRIANEVGSFCSLVNISRKTYSTWQNQYAHPDFITFIHVLNCSFPDDVRTSIRNAILEALNRS